MNSPKQRFSDFALEKLLDLYANHAHEVGSELLNSNPEKYKTYAATDCITYALNVIAYAFERNGDDSAAKQVRRLGRHGTELAAHLVNRHGWRGIYINPDVNHPLDGDSEHVYSHHLALKNCLYYQVPIAYQVVDYSVTQRTHPAFGRLNRRTAVTTLNEIDIAGLELIEFGFGISRGGMHTWLFSKGWVYEVHWQGIGDTLYQRSSLRSYPWLSGAIVVPPDQLHLLSLSSQLKCGDG